ncbi:RCC1 domain-containing protein [Bacillus sp. 7884-1]|uniref:RCC1 domain-containing protein n=1 Tax=Bacillus sp. 7884-1 TaxID=2021693 RepID=UPI000BA79133|nr:hypothetical protein [Bacillus sp. 7884-1]PAE32020.1 hypothetical protein CHI06_27150 [Bacillus sp. 7884-1]
MKKVRCLTKTFTLRRIELGLMALLLIMMNLLCEVNPVKASVTLTFESAQKYSKLISAGYGHSLALKSDGTIASWGDNTYGQTTVPDGLRNVVAIQGGEYHSLALKSDGTVVAWGSNMYEESNVPTGLNNVLAISSKFWQSLALKSDGTVVAWGRNDAGQATVPAGLHDVVAIDAGDFHSLALKSDGTVVAWGDNFYGETTIPTGLSNVVGISAGNWHSLALKSDGTVVAWGMNDKGQTNVPVGLTLWNSDQTPPVTTDNAPKDWVNKDVTVTLTSTDYSGSGVASTYYQLDNGSTKSGNSIIISDDGPHTLTYWSVDNAGNVEAQHTVTVRIDKTEPTLNISLDKTIIWSPNNQMVPVTATINASDATSGIDSVVLASITSNEPLQSDDIQDANYNTPITGSTDIFKLRADRLGNGNRRVYTITFTVSDKAGNVTNKSVTVTVPHDHSKYYPGG